MSCAAELGTGHYLFQFMPRVGGEKKLFELTKNYLPNQLYRKTFDYPTIFYREKNYLPLTEKTRQTSAMSKLASHDSEEISSDDAFDII